jgi:hypothetical protein
MIQQANKQSTSILIAFDMPPYSIAALVRRGFQGSIQDGSCTVLYIANLETAQPEEGCPTLLRQ